MRKRHSSNRVTLWIAGALLSLTSVSAADDTPHTPQQLEFFEKKIRPILVQHCYECHSSESKTLRAGLLVDSREGLLAGGDSGPAIVPGKPEESLLLEALRYGSYEMPPQEKLPASVIADFERWIADGAADPREGSATPATGGIDLAQGREFWSFRPLGQSPPPDTRHRDWVRDPLDAFIAASWEEPGLSPAPPADRATLLRRLSFDLIGLPPTPQEIERFVTDPAEEDIALERVVDRLLASPAFGQRWGRHWLDVARYSDSTGGGRSMLYDKAWRYRDYVIDAFNKDKPFDRFIIEQLAGDLLPADTPQQRTEQLTAVAFLAIGPTNYELQDKVQLRMDVVDEQLDTTGRAFLAMTLGCARCHDHKFDPIPVEDYYALAGIFRSTRSLVDGNVARWVEVPLPDPPEVVRKRKEIEAELAMLKKKLKTAEQAIEQTQAKLGESALTIDDSAATLEGEWTESRSVKGFVGEGYRHATGGDRSARYTVDVTPGQYHIAITYTTSPNRSPNALIQVEHADGVFETRIDQRTLPSESNGHTLGTWKFDTRAVVTISTRGSSGVVVADAVRLIRLDPESSDTEQAQKLTAELADQQEKAAQLRKRQQNLEKKLTPPDTVIAVAEEVEGELGDARICIRGNSRQLGQPVPRGFLQVVAIDEPPRITAQTSGRLELAQWIAHPQNPLTARVFVNRVWQHLFGTGIVRTVDNFGTQGEQPSHPELLDHLALQFMQDGWSVKSLIRRIVLSGTYRQSSAPGEKSLQADPENRLLSHHNRRRLQAEALLDAILTFSGQLDPTLGGPGVRPGTRTEYGYEFDYGRRAVYLPVFRNRLPELFSVYDFPDPNLSVGRRTSTILPTQSLLMLNNPFVLEQAEKAAKRLLQSHSTDTDRLDHAFQLALGRFPMPAERELMQSVLDRAGDDDAARLSAWSSICHSLIASLDFRTLH